MLFRSAAYTAYTLFLAFSLLMSSKTKRSKRSAAKTSAVASILKAAASDDRPLHVSVDNSLFATAPVDIAPIPRGISSANKVFNITGAYETTNAFTTSTSVPIYPAFNYTLDSLGQYASWTSIFDQYRIVQIEARFLPRGSSSLATPFNVGLITSVIDYDDSTALSSVATALDYANELTCEVGRPFLRTFKPKAAMALYGGAFSSFGNLASPWIDAASTAVQHYGLKMAVPTTNTAVQYDAVVKFWLQFRNVR